jgi:hypothetical protein
MLALILAACDNGTTNPPASPSLVSISVSTQPTKITYEIGDPFSSAGLTISATYSDGSISTLTTGWTLSWNDAALAEGSTAITDAAGSNKVVTVTYGGQTTTFGIGVYAALYTVSGTITTSDDASAAGASVQLKADGTASGSPVTAGTNGTYTISGVPDGTYTIDVSLSGYNTGTITGVTVSGANVTGKNLVLQKTDLNDPPPANVTGLVATAGNGQVTLTWTDPADADLKEIEITWTPNGTTPQTVAKGTRTYTATGLTNGNAYTFTVMAKDNAGYLSAGETTTATPDSPPDTTPPGNVTSLAAAAGNGQVTLTWTDPTDADLKEIEITWTPNGTTPQTVAKGTQTKTITGLTNGTPYTFTVKAKDNAENLSAGETTTATPGSSPPPDTTPPAKVTGLAAAAGDGQVSLTWTDPTDTDLKEIEITWTPGDGNATVTKGTQTKIITGLTNRTAYTFTVKAKDTTGNQNTGETTTATPSSSPPPATTSTAQIKVSFTGPEDETIDLKVGDNQSIPKEVPADTELTVSVTGSYDAYRWFLDGQELKSEAGKSSLTASAGYLGVNRHTLTVFVTTKDGVEYSKRLTFTVIK